MSRAQSDLAKQKSDEALRKEKADDISEKESIECDDETRVSGPDTVSAHGRIRNSTLGPRYAEIRAARRENSPTSNSPSSNSPQASPSGANATLKPAASHASVSSTSTQKSTSDSQRRLTPANSVLELKRFFGKGRTKHEHGVKVKPPEDRKKTRATFSLFGIGKKKGATTPSDSKQPSQQQSSSSGASSLFHHHFHHHHHHDAPLQSGMKALHITPAEEDDHFTVKGKPPKDLDPNFVVHGPDYEADWDPFHVFGLEPNSERLPFLESGITKYGEIGRDMGSGAGGSVRMMERPSDNKLFAVKEFRARRPSETPQKYAKHMTAEYALGAALHHKNIIETIDLIKEGDKYYEVMEYAPHDFFEIVMSGGMSTPQINSSFHQIVSGVAYLHSMGVAHRDLKLDNCVVTKDGVVKLIDFGSAVVFKYPMSPQIHLARGVLGSDPYLAPEVFLKHPYQPQCADIWSCGIIYCCTYLRRFPWKIPQKEDSSFRKFAENPDNIDGKLSHHDNPKKITGPWRLLRLLPKDSRPIITRILKIEVKERATVEDIQKDPWFSQIEEISVLPPPPVDQNHH